MGESTLNYRRLIAASALCLGAAALVLLINSCSTDRVVVASLQIEGATYVGDTAPGTIEGNNRHEIIYGDPNGMHDLSLTGGDNVGGKYVAGSGLYWHLAGLYF